jgi:hypothetical protein
MSDDFDEFAAYAEHPRFGKRPRYTGANAETVFGGDTRFHWRITFDPRVAGTAIEADLTRQTPATVPISHYYDERRRCRDCGRKFLFFAEEQKFWYEELGFGLDSDCVRCFACRQLQRQSRLTTARTRDRYEELKQLAEPAVAENLEMAACCLALIESGEFNLRQTEQVRKYLNRVYKLNPDGFSEVREDFIARVAAIESRRR